MTHGNIIYAKHIYLIGQVCLLLLSALLHFKFSWWFISCKFYDWYLSVHDNICIGFFLLSFFFEVFFYLYDVLWYICTLSFTLHDIVTFSLIPFFTALSPSHPLSLSLPPLPLSLSPHSSWCTQISNFLSFSHLLLLTH